MTEPNRNLVKVGFDSIEAGLHLMKMFENGAFGFSHV